jgi:HEPN domain-containing protein
LLSGWRWAISSSKKSSPTESLYMTENESLIPSEWYQIGDRELAAAQLLLAERDKFLSIAGMLLQQALEKYLKGYLLSKGWKLARTHDLGQLLKALVSYEPEFEEYTDVCLRITYFYLEDRYPLRSGSPVEKVELESLLAQAEALIERIRLRSQHSPSGAA